MSSIINPLLKSNELPPFSELKPEHIEPGIRKLIQNNREIMQQLLGSIEIPTWENLVEPLEQANDCLEQSWSPISHMNAVVNTPELRDAYNVGIGLLTQFNTEVSQNEALFKAYSQLAKSEHYQSLSVAQRKVIDNALRDFRLGGVALTGEKKKHFGAITQRLSELSTGFSNNVLDATQAWFKHFTSKAFLAGLPESALLQAAQAGLQKMDAEGKPLGGYVITLDFPSYLAVMMYAENTELREEVYCAYTTRASKMGIKACGDSAEQWDNAPLIKETLALRHEQAQLLGFKHYAERSLASKMAQTSAQVIGFLTELLEKSKPFAMRDIKELRAFAARAGVKELKAWDLVYYSEKLRQEKYAISQEILRPYFPFSKVIVGMFEVVKRLFNISIVEVNDFDSWHEDVKFYHVYKNGKLIAKFYLDIYARENKRGGAWMADCRVRRKIGQKIQLPVAFLTCNFTPPTGSNEALLTHEEVTTLFHEFGHGLHHMLTAIDVAAVSGINGVPWDAVELPSQFMENWCWQEEAVELISGHYETGEALPKNLLDKMLSAKNFQSGIQTMRQLEFALFDFRLHAEYNESEPVSTKSLLGEIRGKYSVFTTPEFNQFENSFSHVFAGGYAAGYYSYKWAEVLSADAFSLFEEQGIFNKSMGDKFLHEILMQGGSTEPMDLFVKFRGREPNINALLRHSGLEEVSDV